MRLATRISESTIPVDFLDVVVHAYRQALAAFGAAALENPATICCCHARTKTMHAHASTNFWLISAFGHTLPVSLIDRLRPKLRARFTEVKSVHQVNLITDESRLYLKVAFLGKEEE